MATAAMLTVLTGPHRGSSFCIRSPCSVVMGRDSACAIRFAGTNRDLSISRRHCQLTFDGEILRIRDLQSTNGTFLDGNQVKAADCPENPDMAASGADLVNHGDVLTIGGTSLRIELKDCPMSDDTLDCQGLAIVRSDCCAISC